MSFAATPADANNVPMSSVVPDGTNTPTALEGGPSKSTGGNNLAPAAVYQYDGYSVTFGAQADSAATSDTGTFSLIALFKRGLQKLTTIVSALTAGQATMSASIPVAIASDQTPKTSTTATRTNVAAATSDTSLLASNSSRKGAIFFNDSTAILYIAYGAGAASTTSYTVQVAPGGYFELPAEPVFTGAIRGIWSAANGNLRITELS